MRVFNNRLTRWAADRLAGWACAYIDGTPEASFQIRRLDGTVYMRRWFVIPRNRFCNVYLHEYLADDEDRALHDHPWWSASLCLVGDLVEIYRPVCCSDPHEETRTVESGSLVLRSAKFTHRLEVPVVGSITLFVTGPKLRTWGFWCRKGWMDWRTFVGDRGGPAPGCGEMA